MSVSSLLLLILCNVMWSATYVASKGLLRHYLPLEVAFLRFAMAALPLVVYGLRGGGRSSIARWILKPERLDWRMAIVGATTFFLAPVLQMYGLSLSRAVDGSLMVALEPLITILLAAFLLGERLRPVHAASLVVAILGVGIVTEIELTRAISFSKGRLVGNGLLVLALFGDAAYSSVAKPALKMRSPLLFFTVSIAIGALFLLAFNLLWSDPRRMAGLAVAWERGDLGDLARLAFLSWASTLFGYLYWMHLLKDTKVADIALTLYLQPLLGTAWGYVFMGESVTTHTVVGAALIFFAVWLGCRVGWRNQPG